MTCFIVKKEQDENEQGIHPLYFTGFYDIDQKPVWTYDISKAVRLSFSIARKDAGLLGGVIELIEEN